MNEQTKLVTRQELYEAVWAKPITTLTKDWNTNYAQIVEACALMEERGGNGAERQEVLHRLMRRTVLAVAHCLMREDKNGGQLHQSREPDGGSRVITKNEEGRAEWAQLREGESVYRRRHRVFAYAEMQVLSPRAIGLKMSCAFIG